MCVSHMVIGAKSICLCVSNGYWSKQYMCVSHMVIGASSICVCLKWLLEQTVYVCVSYGYWSKQHMCVSQMVIGANSICVCLKWLLEQTPIIYLNSIDQLVFASQKCGVYSDLVNLIFI